MAQNAKPPPEDAQKSLSITAICDPQNIADAIDAVCADDSMPGGDGFASAFYKEHKETISARLGTAYEAMLRKGCLEDEMTGGLLYY